MGYVPRITIEKYVMAMLRGDNALLPSRLAGCITVWHEDFEGDEPQVSDLYKIVLVDQTGGNGYSRENGSDPQLLYRATELVIEALGMTGDGTKPGNKDSFWHTGGRDIFLKFGNARARKLLITWRDDACPSCEEYQIYTMYNGGTEGTPLLNRGRVFPCKVPGHSVHRQSGPSATT